MNTNRLKGKFVENELTYTDVANLLGISRISVVNKINGKTKSGFSAFEASRISQMLNLTASETLDIFFDQQQDLK